ncbi:MAG: hypothetical protein WBM02_06370 [bacterium]
MKNNKINLDDQHWENGFEGHSDAQLIRMSKLTFEQKLKWLETIGRLLRRLQKSGSSSSIDDSSRERDDPQED